MFGLIELLPRRISLLACPVFVTEYSGGHLWRNDAMLHGRRLSGQIRILKTLLLHIDPRDQLKSNKLVYKKQVLAQSKYFEAIVPEVRYPIDVNSSVFSTSPVNIT